MASNKQHGLVNVWVALALIGGATLAMTSGAFGQVIRPSADGTLADGGIYGTMDGLADNADWTFNQSSYEGAVTLSPQARLEHRVVFEYDLSSVTKPMPVAAQLSFALRGPAIFPMNDVSVEVYAYPADGKETLSDFATAPASLQGKVIAKAFQASTNYSLNVSGAVNNAIISGVRKVAFRFQLAGSVKLTAGQAFIEATDSDATTKPTLNISADLSAKLVSRNVFYNNSYYDNNDAGIDAGTGAKTDSASVDTTKSPLATGGGAATFANWTGYAKGINGLIYDVEVGASSRDPQASDFTFTDTGKAGATASPVSPSASSLIVLQASGPRKVRAVFTFADASVKNTWLKVDIGTGFGLASGETHYWGNAAGDANMGNTAANILVSAADELAISAHITTALNRSLVTDPYDVNKDSVANASDQLYVRGNLTSSLNCVKVVAK